MKRFAVAPALFFFILAGPFVLLAGVARAQDAPNTTSPRTRLAPADEYFGRYRMSVLGMRNAIRDIGRRVEGAVPSDVAELYDKLKLVEDAVLDLRDRYPRDTWLPKLGLSIAQAFARMPVAGARAHFNTDLDWVIADFPASNEAFYANGMRRTRLEPVVARDVPIEPLLPSYAVPLPR